MEMIIQRFTQTLMWPSGSSLITISRYKLKLGSNITKLKKSFLSFFVVYLIGLLGRRLPFSSFLPSKHIQLAGLG